MFNEAFMRRTRGRGRRTLAAIVAVGAFGSVSTSTSASVPGTIAPARARAKRETFVYTVSSDGEFIWPERKPNSASCPRDDAHRTKLRHARPVSSTPNVAFHSWGRASTATPVARHRTYDAVAVRDSWQRAAFARETAV